MKVFVLALVALVPSILPAQVTLTLEEYRKLVEAAEAPPPPRPVVKPPVFRSADYEIKVEGDQATVIAKFRAEALDEPPGSILIPNAGLVLESMTPADALLSRRDDALVWALAGRQANVLDVRFLAGLEPVRNGKRLAVPVAPSITAALRLSGVPEGWTADVNPGLPAGEGMWKLPPGSSVEILLRPKPTEPAKPVAVAVVPMPPVIRQAQNKTRLVRDGTFLTALEWTLMHDEPIPLQVRPGAGAQWVACKVAGRPVAPTEVTPGVFEIPITSESGPTKVELAYTGSGRAFEPVRGEFHIALPGSDLLAESVQWELTLPDDFEPVAVEGNCEFLPSKERHVLNLRRELSRGDAPQVRIFYQKPEAKQP